MEGVYEESVEQSGFLLRDVWDISVQSTFQTCFLSALKTDEMSH